LFCAAPRTPLRVLAIIALDTVHVLRTSRRLPRRRLAELAMVLDFQAWTNAAWDRKDLCQPEYRASLRRLEQAGLGLYIEDYLRRLRALESRRPPIGGDRQNFDDVRAYREAVARLSLATVTAIALDTECLEGAIRATEHDRDVSTLYRMALQCQIIDDVLDYPADLSASLPSYLSATASLPEAVECTAHAARSYSSGHGVFPLRVALCILSGAARLVVRMGPRSQTSTVTVSPYYLL
jgi:hypothetical protein